MDSRDDLNARQFQQALEREVERHRGSHIPGGFIIPERLDRELGFVKQARAIAANYDITAEQACFALLGTIRQMD